MSTPTLLIAVYADSPSAWRQWLAENQATERSVWLAIYKKASDKPSVTYDEAVDEALCFGWIDSSVRKGDADHYFQFFTRRSPRSNWSRVNKAKVDKLLKAGKMTEAGMVMVDLAKRTGTWTALDEVENLICPPDLAAEFHENPMAKGYFDAFPKSVKRGILEWLLNAKTATTRAKRIREIVTLAERNERANQYVPKST
ncbi:YdeI/OmpD-associated family protein [Spirosoma sp.]|uniref:YdeI/OmpD-associated family protein n=1 Tax=Spirosoma sp. TaxID=1899569 RepID=UPI00261635FA|nr:YdeI/OmpD-associated family protein [Spirosoma sp.]MCX6214026.1 YdeI/OmpD-associated family protein [Spirosoma sp.]